MRVRRYTELAQLSTFDERFEYLKLTGQVGEETFGFDRPLNQGFYTSREWRQLRNFVIVRDNGCDLGIDGWEIHDKVIIHHMNPMTVEEVVHGDDSILDPEFLITTSHRTHNAIHFGRTELAPREFVERRPGDTKLW